MRVVIRKTSDQCPDEDYTEFEAMRESIIAAVESPRDESEDVYADFLRFVMRKASAPADL